jgi:hypothetical protein
MIPLRAALFLGLLAAPALAQDWHPLTGGQIKDALSARVLAYPDDKTQNFFADGRTLYEGGGSAQWGQWRIEGDRYCSVWPPSDRWSCYGVEGEAAGLDLRFVTEGGSVTQGRYIDLQ